jgi:plasmid stabilization system protein ParE
VDYQLFYTQRALSDLAGIVGRIAEDDPKAAALFGDSLLDHIDLVCRFPRMGAVLRKRSRVRKLVHTPIIVYYAVDEKNRTIDVIHLRHASRRPPGRELDPDRG